jgi:hypothetical protein
MRCPTYLFRLWLHTIDGKGSAGERVASHKGKERCQLPLACLQVAGRVLNIANMRD